MKNLTEFKRALVVGSKWECFDMTNEKRNGIRTVKKLQTNSVQFEWVNQNGVNETPWLEFPKAAFCTFNEDAITIYTRGATNPMTGKWDESIVFPHLVYKKVE